MDCVIPYYNTGDTLKPIFRYCPTSDMYPMENGKKAEAYFQLHVSQIVNCYFMFIIVFKNKWSPLIIHCCVDFARVHLY